MAEIDVPVLIVGGGGAGLSASMLLSKLGIASYLISSLPHTSLLPKAHVLHQRVMEIFLRNGGCRRHLCLRHPGQAHGRHRLVHRRRRPA